MGLKERDSAIIYSLSKIDYYYFFLIKIILMEYKF